MVGGVAAAIAQAATTWAARSRAPQDGPVSIRSTGAAQAAAPLVAEPGAGRRAAALAPSERTIAIFGVWAALRGRAFSRSATSSNPDHCVRGRAPPCSTEGFGESRGVIDLGQKPGIAARFSKSHLRDRLRFPPPRRNPLREQNAPGVPARKDAWMACEPGRQVSIASW
jgi:hypothetical protein